MESRCEPCEHLKKVEALEDGYKIYCKLEIVLMSTEYQLASGEPIFRAVVVRSGDVGVQGNTGTLFKGE